MSWVLQKIAFLVECEKIATERKKPLHEKVVDTGAPILAGAGIGRTLSDLSLHERVGASPRRKTIGTILGALSGMGYRVAETKKKERKKAHKALSKTAEPFKFTGTATKRFLSKPGKSIHDLAPKIGRLGTLPK